MKIILSLSAFILAGSISFHVSAQTKKIELAFHQLGTELLAVEL